MWITSAPYWHLEEIPQVLQQPLAGIYVFASWKKVNKMMKIKLKRLFKGLRYRGQTSSQKVKDCFQTLLDFQETGPTGNCSKLLHGHANELRNYEFFSRK